MSPSDQNLIAFLDPQLRDHGGHTEIAPGFWGLLAVEAADAEANTRAAEVLAQAPFKFETGASEDDRWTLYYVDAATRETAAHWLEDFRQQAAGEVRPLPPAHRALIRELPQSNMPHRAAQKLVELHARGEIGAGSFREPAVVRALLDRLHLSEPLFLSALQMIMADHLVDMIVLLRQIIPEDLAVGNDLTRQAYSRDPFERTGQEAAAGIRNLLTRFHVINPLDQQKNSAVTNPYAAFLELVREGDIVRAPIDGNTVNLPREALLDATRSTRRVLYRGEAFASVDTQAPWMRPEIAYAFRFLKQRLESRRDLATMDGLYMFERAVE